MPARDCHVQRTSWQVRVSATCAGADYCQPRLYESAAETVGLPMSTWLGHYSSQGPWPCLTRCCTARACWHAPNMCFMLLLAATHTPHTHRTQQQQQLDQASLRAQRRAASGADPARHMCQVLPYRHFQQQQKRPHLQLTCTLCRSCTSTCLRPSTLPRAPCAPSSGTTATASPLPRTRPGWTQVLALPARCWPRVLGPALLRPPRAGHALPDLP